MAKELKRPFSKEGKIIQEIAKKKDITLVELAKRVGYSHTPSLRNRMLEGEGMSIVTLRKICDALGVDLCIIDGYRVYRLTEEHWSPELDPILSRLAKESECDKVDRYNERIEAHKEADRELKRSYRESDREGYNEYMREYMRQKARNKPLIEDGNLCYRCEYYERKLKKDGKGYCVVKDKYTAVDTEKGCEHYRESE